MPASSFVSAFASRNLAVPAPVPSTSVVSSLSFVSNHPPSSSLGVSSPLANPSLSLSPSPSLRPPVHSLRTHRRSHTLQTLPLFSVSTPTASASSTASGSLVLSKSFGPDSRDRQSKDQTFSQAQSSAGLLHTGVHTFTGEDEVEYIVTNKGQAGQAAPSVVTRAGRWGGPTDHQRKFSGGGIQNESGQALAPARGAVGGRLGGKRFSLLGTLGLATATTPSRPSPTILSAPHAAHSSTILSSRSACPDPLAPNFSSPDVSLPPIEQLTAALLAAQEEGDRTLLDQASGEPLSAAAVRAAI
eukprot:gb/GEZN01011145.1/.p1 GENE.gb/GEZN01011145.1/~~gb/GEZN01011145.1/.p1  ORF type:complete len:338 (+),score=39.23 gb/GEZN01011145.1/:112-1014(+)